MYPVIPYLEPYMWKVIGTEFISPAQDTDPPKMLLVGNQRGIWGTPMMGGRKQKNALR